MRWIADQQYEELMRTEAEPYLAARRETGFDERVAGQPIYYEHYRADSPKGVIVISHGFTESIRKYAESIFYMLQAGYEVWGADHRGHGKSYRSNSNPFVVHTDRFEDYVLDLKHLVDTRVRPAAGELPLYLFCHSMGGCVGAWTVETYPELFKKAVLSSPMLGLRFGKIPLPVAAVVATLKSIGEKGKEPLSPVTEFKRERFEDSASNAETRFNYYNSQRLADEKLQTCAPSTSWGREAIRACRRVCSGKEVAKIKIPVLLMQAGGDTVVHNPSQDAFAAGAANCELVTTPGMKHELFMSDTETLVPYWEKIFAFLES